jgi:predicted RNA-binding protein with PUA-like domain
MNRWLLKSEPSSYSWDDLVRAGNAEWDGVRNLQAANNLKAMKKGDRAFFYHSGEERAVVGTAEIVRPAFPDPSDKTGRFVAVGVAPLAPAETPVMLAHIKAEPRLKNMALIRQPRLSVSPVTEAEWMALCCIAGLKP